MVIFKHTYRETVGESIEEAMSVSAVTSYLPPKDAKKLITYSWLWSFLLLLAVPFACIYSGEGIQVFYNLWLIFISPSKLVTDYFQLGGLGASFLNAALCGFACNFAMLVFKARPQAVLLAGYFLVIAHCFYGLNFFNMWPPFLGVMLFCLVCHQRIGDMLHLAMFSTSLAPFISDFLFRYTIGDKFQFGKIQLTFSGFILALIFGLLSGFLVPALLPGTAKMNRGHNLFKAGLAIGLFGTFAYALFYKTLGIPTPDQFLPQNPLYDSHGNSYLPFLGVFFATVFLLTLALGFFQNGRSFKGYKKIWRCDGWRDDFVQKFGMPLTMINIGVYGLCVLAYLNLTILMTDGVGYTGPTAGVTIAAITFSASGQTPRNVWPIAVGYLLLFAVASGVCSVFGLPISWTLSTQAYINGLAFATGLCPFAGRFGRKVGIIAGMLNAVLCTSTSSMHGGFVLYNGGFTAGLTALLLLPVLEFYHFHPRKVKDEE